MHLPRIMLAAPASGSGKTLLTCGLLQVLKNRGIKAASFKCGPDYIDPMFHRKIIGVPAKNLDTFFTGEEMTRYLFGREAEKADISILEGVMGFYDGAGGMTTAASSYELAKVTDTPVILIVNARGMSLSALPVIKGFLEFQEDSHIAGVILNQTSSMVYGMLKKQIEQQFGIKAFGYVPKCPELVIKSRHLGLITPEEIEDLQEKLQQLSELLEETLDIAGILECADSAAKLSWKEPEELVFFQKDSLKAGETGSALKSENEKLLKAESRSALKSENEKSLKAESRSALKAESEKSLKSENEKSLKLEARKTAKITEKEKAPRIGVARDEAFCFYYQDNLELMEEMGAGLVYFSPIHDKCLPKHLDGLIFYGGYPELYAKELSGNTAMREEIKSCLNSGMPYLAECGGFMYLQKTMEDMEGNVYPMAGIFEGTAYSTEKLGRFGYITLTAQNDSQLLKPKDSIRGHEFHYFDCTDNGTDYHGKKPFGSREWDCIHGGAQYAAGFPHLYYYSNPAFIYEFLQQCVKFAGKEHDNRK